MNEELNSTPEPTVQPVSIHDTPHKHHGALPLVAVMLGVFLVLESIALGYVIANKSSTNAADDVDAVQERRDKIAEIKKKVPPFLYVKDGNKVMSVDRLTGDESLVMENTENQKLSIFAVPQRDYNGKVFISQSCSECDNPYFSVFELDLTQPTPTPVSMGSFLRGSTQVSPDQAKFAYIPYSSDVSHAETGNEILVVNLIGSDEYDPETLAKPEGLYFYSSFYPEAEIGPGIDGFNFIWSDLNCVTAGLYELPQTDVPVTTNTYAGAETFCSEE